MSEVAIKVENLSKQYRLGEIGTGSIAHDLNRWIHRLRGKDDPYLKIGDENDRTSVGNSEYVWALRNIDFEIKQGDAVGIIGRNGAGKSTLLKILSKTTSPTTGAIKIKGRIASLLEVGTGFHPELSGRDNIFLNGAILGMTKKEIKSKFDEIVDFAGVERYIDTPVKRYSSGMYVRLAFGVAAHLEPDILVVDEVLAVGDAEFQKKALGKMQDVSNTQGRTVLFVSHNMGAITQLCNNAIYLKNGHLVKTGKADAVVDYYIEQNNQQGKRTIQRDAAAGENHFTSIFMTDENKVERSDYKYDEEVAVNIEINIPKYDEALELAMRLIDRHKRAVFTIHEKIKDYYNSTGFYKFNIKIPPKFLTPGTYSWIMGINHPGVLMYDLQEDIAIFTTLETGSDFSRYDSIDYGSVFANYQIQDLSK